VRRASVGRFSGTGRYRQFQRVSRGVARAPAVGFAVTSRSPTAGLASATGSAFNATVSAIVPGVFSESFDKADGALGPDLTWSVGTSAPVVVSMQAEGSPFSLAFARAEHDTGSPDMYVQADITVSDDDDDLVILVGRTDNAGTIDFGQPGVVVQIDGATSPTLTAVSTYDLFDGTFYDVFSDTGIDMVATWRMELDGTDARIYRNGVLLLTSDISANTSTGTRAGFALNDVSTPPVAIDNFEFGDLP
jgi:hypothetical protein